MMALPPVVYKLPAQYDATNEVTLRDARQALDKYIHMLRWTEGEAILDVGCGSGNVTAQVLAPRLPKDHKLLVGVDLSEYNVKYATQNYGDHRTTFLQGNIIEPDFQTLKAHFEKQNISPEFDKIFSLHCLDWVNSSVLTCFDRPCAIIVITVVFKTTVMTMIAQGRSKHVNLKKKWSRNIYSLLKPNGQTFLMFFTKSAFLEMWIEAAFTERWRPYTNAVGPYRSEFHNSTDIDSDLTRMMKNAGFIVESCEHYPCYYDNNWTDENMFKLFQSADMYVHTIPEELHSDYFEDLFRVYKKYKHAYRETGMPYTVSVIVAHKPEN